VPVAKLDSKGCPGTVPDARTPVMLQDIESAAIAKTKEDLTAQPPITSMVATPRRTWPEKARHANGEKACRAPLLSSSAAAATLAGLGRSRYAAIVEQGRCPVGLARQCKLGTCGAAVVLFGTTLAASGCSSEEPGSWEAVGTASDAVVVCAGGAVIQGIDVSYHQNTID